MAGNDRKSKDPVLGFNYAVEISGLIVGGFSQVSGLNAEIETFDYREGGVNDYVHKCAGPVRYPSNLVLRKGITDSKDLWSWYCDVMRGTIQRKPVDVVLMDSAGDEKRRWKLQNAYPVKWSGPDLKATASDVAIDVFELAHEGLSSQ